MRIERIPVLHSKNVISFGYDSSEKTLDVEFTNGDVYSYIDVPETVYRELLTANSKGKFINANIKWNFPFIMIEKEDKNVTS